MNGGGVKVSHRMKIWHLNHPIMDSLGYLHTSLGRKLYWDIGSSWLWDCLCLVNWSNVCNTWQKLCKGRDLCQHCCKELEMAHLVRVFKWLKVEVSFYIACKIIFCLCVMFIWEVVSETKLHTWEPLYLYAA